MTRTVSSVSITHEPFLDNIFTKSTVAVAAIMESQVTSEIRNICMAIKSRRYASATLALNVFLGGIFVVLVATLLAYRWKPRELRRRRPRHYHHRPRRRRLGRVP